MILSSEHVMNITVKKNLREFFLKISQIFEICILVFFFFKKKNGSNNRKKIKLTNHIILIT
jgi:hypothetical protein